MIMKKHLFFFALFFSIAFGIGPALAVEPDMADYTAYPVFTVNPVKPNILIILDNSGSMNYNAYGSYPGDGGTVSDEPYAGEPFTPTFTKRVAASADDAEERLTDNYTYNTSDGGDLDIGDLAGAGAIPTLVGVRFQNVQIPPGSQITNAYIEFTADTVSAGADIVLKITGEASDNAAAFPHNTNNGLSSRAQTTASATWTEGNWTVVNDAYQTDDIKAVVQEIVDRDGWKSGNAMALFLQYSNDNNMARRANSYNGDSNRAPKLYITYTQAEGTQYYGYFNPDYFYEWSANKFAHKYKKVSYDTTNTRWNVTTLAGASTTLTDAQIVAQGLYDGNWMNWATMRRVDVARKVMMGGLATARTGGGNQTLYGEVPAQASRTFVRNFDSTVSPGAAVTPYDSNKYYGLKDGYLYFDGADGDTDPFDDTRVRLAIQKSSTYEPNDFYEGNVSGVLQKVGDKAYWGNEFFYYGTGNNREGGYIASRIGTNMTTLVTDLQNTPADTWTPLAEAYYVATQYFKQQQPESGLGYHNSAIGATNNTNDPYKQSGETIPCAKSFVILLTDGASTKDSKIPASLKDTDGDGDNTACNETTETNCDYASGGTDYLDDVALYARTTDLRADLEGDQNIILYPIYAFGNENNARSLLIDAAKNGGFNDKNGNGVPDGGENDAAADRLEWDGNGDTLPDTYFEAQNGALLESKLLEAINDILRRAASGTAVSVLATSSEGEGNLVQAYFRPVVTTGIRETKWIGYLQSLWVDSLGYLREDTNGNAELNIDADKVLGYFIDDNGNTKVNKYPVTALNPYPDVAVVIPEEKELGDIEPIWEAGTLLAERDPEDGADPRKIFTYIEGAAVADVDLYGGVSFNKSTAARRDLISPYLGVKDATAWSYLGTTHAARAENLIHFIRGNDSGFTGTTSIRPRTVQINGVDKVWRLGDIVHSTPVSISVPPDNYGLIYSDQTYQDFQNYHKTRTDRETMVYVGANDGMLHAFTSWQYNATDKKFEKPTGTPAAETIGKEVWAYIPRALLPHLKWLADTDYTHVYYVDLKPKIFDAKIFYNTLGDDSTGTIDTTYHKNGWGTILVGGLRMGGKSINAAGDFDYNAGTADTTKTFTSSYFAIDISNPRSPKLLWEKTYTDLNLTTNEPAVAKVGDKWFLVFGSGPEDYEGDSTDNAHIYIVDLATGAPYKNGANDWLFETSNDDAFMGGVATLDKGLNFNVDGIYMGESHQVPGGDWEGAMYKVTVPWVCVAGTCAGIDDPKDAVNPWYLSKLFTSPGPITAPPTLSIDFSDNAWVYFGTGRYLSDADKTNTDSQYLFGIKDPFFNQAHTLTGQYKDNYFDNYSSSLTLTTSNLFDADIYKVITPWGTLDLPAGDCSGVVNGQVGDIYASTDPGSCVCSYDWPVSTCTEPGGAGSCAAAGVTMGEQVFDNGSCVCVPFVAPSWVCKDVVAGSCDSVPEGVVSNNANYHSLYWRCVGANDDSCTSVTSGAIGAGLGDGTCTCSEVVPPAWSCDQRAAGDCDLVATAPTYGDTGDKTDTNGGSCRVGYWGCNSADPVGDPDACETVNYEATTGFLGAAGDGDYFGNGTCICSFVSSPVAVVINTTNNLGQSFESLVALARTYDGWKRTLPDPGERMLSKPAVLGGLTLFTSYVPSSETCSFGGYSYLWALYFETGTAYRLAVFDPGTEVVAGAVYLAERYSLGLGQASSVGIHVGKEEGGKAKGFVQQSTGVIRDILIDPAFNIRSGLRYWWEN